MEEPLQPRAPQLRAGALREQSGEAATPASLGGPTLSRQPLLAPAFSSDTAPPQLSSSTVVITPLARIPPGVLTLLSPGPKRNLSTLPNPFPPPRLAQGALSKFHPSRHPALWLPDNQLVSFYPSLQTPLRSLQSSPWPGPSPRPPPPRVSLLAGLPATQVLAGPTLAPQRPFPAPPTPGWWFWPPSFPIQPLAPPCPVVSRRVS